MAAPTDLSPSAAPAAAPPSPPATPARARIPWPAPAYVAALAFLLASFPVRGSDLWRHLAAGRAAAWRDGPGWLFDVLLYGLYTAAGGPGLVVAKALLVAGLALVLFRLCRAGPGRGTAAFCTALAVLTLGIRLPLQPATVSLLLLALALWAARWDAPAAEPRRPLPGWLPPLALLPLFVVWVNLDGWFVLGLATLALVWLGQGLDALPAAGPRTLLHRVAALALVAAACLCNPAFGGAFVLPPELAGPAAAPRLGSQVTSPFAPAYWTGVGLTPVGLAYFPLLGLGLVSFLMNLPRWPWRRFLPWLGLAALGAVQIRAVPFFAVVAGPVLAYNLHDYFARHPVSEREGWLTPRDVRALWPLALALAGLVLLAAWPGWLQGPPYEPRRWAVETLASPEAAAVEARRWHQDGLFGPDARGLHLAAETDHAFAWFCPDEGRVFDPRLAAPFFGLAAGDLDWGKRLRAAGVTYVVVAHPDQRFLYLAFSRLLNDPEHWPLLYTAGDVAVFGWRDPDRPGSAALFRGHEFDAARLAFRPTPDERAPRQGPDRDAAPRYFWEAFWKPALRPSPDRDAATLHLMHAETLQRTAENRHLLAWDAGQLAGLAAAAGGWAGPAGAADAYLRAAVFQPVVEPGPGARVTNLDRLALTSYRYFKLYRDDAPPALLYPAVRAARRALADDPDDARTLVVLGRAYRQLLTQTRERVWGKRLVPLTDLRWAQASWALNQAAVLRPDRDEVHFHLARLYEEMNYLDLALHHYRTHQQLLLKAGPPPGMPPATFREQAAAYEQRLNRLAEQVEDKESLFAAESARLRLQDRARNALEKGLAGKALAMLREADVSAFGKDGMVLELELLLKTGQAREVREWVGPEQLDKLGAEYYHWVRARALAAVGDYALAGDELTRLAAVGRDPDNPKEGPREVLAQVIGREVLAQQPGAESLPRFLVLGRQRADFRARVAGLAESMRQEADWSALRGLVALEEGEVAEAAAALGAAVTYWRGPPETAIDFAARPLAEGALAWLER